MRSRSFMVHHREGAIMLSVCSDKQFGFQSVAEYRSIRDVHRLYALRTVPSSM